MTVRKTLFFLIALILCVPAHAFAAQDLNLTPEGKVPGTPFENLQQQIDNIRADLLNIELTPGPQGPQGEPGTSSWFDGFGTVSTFGSVQIGNDTADCTNANAGTIRFNNGAFEGCDGTAWVSLCPPASSSFACGVDQVQDADGNMYNTVMIGTQCWMAENLNVGTMIAGSSEMSDNTVIEKYCYDNDMSNCETFGGLYQWDEMMQYSTTEGVQGICPTGWHVPTDTEWKTMEMALGMSQTQADSLGWRGTDQGIQLKSGGGSGFNDPLAGIRDTDGSFHVLGVYSLFYTSTTVIGTEVWYRNLYSEETRVNRGPSSLQPNIGGFSVRCVMD